MTPKERTAMQQALEEIRVAVSCAEVNLIPEEHTLAKFNEAITALREALAEHPVSQEPVHSEQYWLHECNQKFLAGYEKGRASCKHDERMKALAISEEHERQRKAAGKYEHGYTVEALDHSGDANEMVEPDCQCGDKCFPIFSGESEYCETCGKLVTTEQQDNTRSSIRSTSEYSEQAGQEPVIWHSVWDYVDVRRDPPEQVDEPNWIPLYTHPVRTKYLTADEIWEVFETHSSDVIKAVRAVIAADREKNK